MNNFARLFLIYLLIGMLALYSACFSNATSYTSRSLSTQSDKQQKKPFSPASKKNSSSSSSLSHSTQSSSPTSASLSSLPPSSSSSSSISTTHAATSSTNPTERRVYGTPKGPLTLEACFDLAVLRSETLGLRQEDIRFAQAVYLESIGSALPQIRFTATESFRDRQNFGGFNFGNAGGTGSTDSDAFNIRKDQFETRLNVRYPFFTGFREWNTIAANRANVEARRQDKRRAYELLYLDVTDAFYQTMFYTADLKVLYALQDALQKRAEELEHRISIGRSKKGDLLLTQSELADTRITIEAVRGLLNASKEILAFLIGIPAVQIELVETRNLPGPQNLERYLVAVGDRSDVLAALAEEREARRRLSVAKGERWGVASVDANYVPYRDPTNRGDEDWSVFLTYELPIFDGGAIEARVSQQKAAFRRSQLTVEQLKRSSARDVRIAWHQLNAAVQRALKAEEDLIVSQENLNVQTEDYKLGRISNLDVIDAMRRLHDVRRRLLNAQNDVRINFVKLHVQAGQIAKQENAASTAISTSSNES